MGYRVVTGEFGLLYEGQRRVGSSPDGDSIWFKPDKKTGFDGIGGRSAKLNPGGFTQLRLEGIDALELHYDPDHHQSVRPAKAARDLLLAEAGFTSVSYTGTDLQLIVEESTPPAAPGHVLCRSIDPYGRPVVFVYAGPPPKFKKPDYHLDVPYLNRSINTKLIANGLAYPSYYTERNGRGGLPADLRQRLTALATAARSAGRGLWSEDVSTRPTAIPSLNKLETLATWPKLFRRLVSYFKDGATGLGGFDAWLRADASKRDDEAWIIPRAELGRLHDVVEVKSSKIRMLYRPEDLIIVPR